jgi:predicted transposase YbfD/YdcC
MVTAPSRDPLSLTAPRPALSSSTANTPLPLLEVLAEVPDFRQARGRRHPLAAILALSCAAMLCGARGCRAIAEWGRNYEPELMRQLGFTHVKTPCPSTLHTVFRHLDWQALEEKLRRWSEALLAALPLEGGLEGAGAARPERPAVAIDGKTLRGSRKQGAPESHLLSALSHRLGLTLTHEPVGDKTNEIKAVQTVLKRLLLEGSVVTVDALLTQREVATTIREGGGHYVMIVKGNQPQLQTDIAELFAEPPWPSERRTTASTHEVGHGRIERRQLTTSDALVGYSDWPGLAQVFELQRTVTCKKSGATRAETVYGVTSLSLQEAGAAELLRFSRGHWRIENQSHWVRDVTFDEDRSQVRSGNLPKVLAALRTSIIGLLRARGHASIAAATRRLAARPRECLVYLGALPEN